MQIREILLSELDKAYELVNQQYKTMKYKEYEDLIYQMIKENYKILIMLEQNKPVIYVGLKIQTDLTNKKHLYISEFIINQTYNTPRYTKEINNYLKTYAKTHACENIIKNLK